MGKKKAQRVLEFETEWLRSYARAYLPTETGFSWSPARLRAIGVDLVHVLHVLKNGSVTFDDKLDDPGAIWVAEGQDQDGRWLRLELHIVSETPSVTLQEVEIIESESSDDNAA